MEGYIETTLIGYIADEPIFRPGEKQNYLNFTVRVPFLVVNPDNPAGPKIWNNEYWRVVLRDPLATSVQSFAKMNCPVFITGTPRWRCFEKPNGEKSHYPQIMASIFKVLPSNQEKNVSESSAGSTVQSKRSSDQNTKPMGGFSHR